MNREGELADDPDLVQVNLLRILRKLDVVHSVDQSSGKLVIDIESFTDALGLSDADAAELRAYARRRAAN